MAGYLLENDLEKTQVEAVAVYTEVQNYLRSWLEGLKKIKNNRYIINRDETNSN